MLSRVAESIYWMSRYLERAQNIARLIDVHGQLVLDQPRVNPQDHWAALLHASCNYDAFLESHPTPGPESAFHFLAFDSEHTGSMLNCISYARENARGVREILSGEFWEQINALYHEVNDASTKDASSAQLQHECFFSRVKALGLSFEGIVNGTMSQQEEALWFRIGQLLERADQTSRILDVKYFVLLPSSEDVGTPLDQIQWSGLLRSISALQVYRSEYGAITPANVVELLVLGRRFPRAILYCVTEADSALRQILGTQAGFFRNEAEQLLGQLTSELNYQTVDNVLANGLHEYIDRFQNLLTDVGEAVHSTYFTH